MLSISEHRYGDTIVRQIPAPGLMEMYRQEVCEEVVCGRFRSGVCTDLV